MEENKHEYINKEYIRYINKEYSTSETDSCVLYIVQWTVINLPLQGYG